MTSLFKKLYTELENSIGTFSNPPPPKWNYASTKHYQEEEDGEDDDDDLEEVSVDREPSDQEKNFMFLMQKKEIFSPEDMDTFNIALLDKVYNSGKFGLSLMELDRAFVPGFFFQKKSLLKLFLFVFSLPHLL